MKQNPRNIVLFVLSLFVTVACIDRSQNRKLVEAAEIHRDMMAQHDSIYTMLKERENELMQKMKQVGDTDPNYEAYKSMMRSIAKGQRLLKSWREGVVGVPGMEHEHNEDVPHSHDHQNDEKLKSMSDQEILELQEAYSTRLDQLSTKIDELYTTMDMFSQNVK
jgi:uncharacterized protein